MRIDRIETFHPIGIGIGLVSAACVVLAISFCTPASSATDSGCASVSSSADACVLPSVARDNTSGKAWADTRAAAALHCGVTADVVDAMWAAHTQAEVLEGFVPKALGTGGGDR